MLEIVDVFLGEGNFSAKCGLVELPSQLFSFVWETFVGVGCVAGVDNMLDAETVGSAKDRADVVDGADVP